MRTEALSPVAEVNRLWAAQAIVSNNAHVTRGPRDCPAAQGFVLMRCGALAYHATNVRTGEGRVGFADKIRHWRKKAGAHAAMRHVAGPRRFDLQDHEVALVLVGRNAGFYLQTFVDYHRAFGMDYFVYVDNASDDDSVDIARAMPNTIVGSCDLPFRDYESVLRYEAATRFLRGGWRLFIDFDELFDYPGSDRTPLPDLIQHMMARGHTALPAQMLEMVPPGKLSAYQGMDFDQTIKAFNSYSLADIRKVDYHDPELRIRWFFHQNRITNPDIKILYGGLRNTIFGEDCCLIKHPLFRMGPGVTPMKHPHVTIGVTCTDFSAVLRHYKFSGDFLRREQERLSSKRLVHVEGELRMKRFEEDPDVSFLLPSTRYDPTPEKLLDEGFLVANGDARRMLKI